MVLWASDTDAGETAATEAVRGGLIDGVLFTTASRDFESNIGMIQQTDRLMDRAINQLGRFA